jgi:hypothetical protein
MTRYVQRAALALAATLLGAGCSTVHVDAERDPHVDLSAFRTFSISDGTVLGAGGAMLPPGSPANVEIRDALVKNLNAKGLTENEADPDLVVTYVGGAHRRTELVPATPPVYGTWGVDPWGPGWWSPTYDAWWSQTYTQGTLTVDMVDPKTKRIVWRAYGTADLDGADAKTRIDEVLRKAFEKFPVG